MGGNDLSSQQGFWGKRKQRKNHTLGNMNMFLGMQEQLNFYKLSLKRRVYDREMHSPMNVLANESITMLVKTPNQHIAWLRHQQYGLQGWVGALHGLQRYIQLV